MSYRGLESGRSNLAGGPTGREPFFNALHKKAYPNGRQSASPGLPIYVTGPNGRKCAGHVVSREGKRILRKTNVSQAKHFCLKHRGWGVESDALRQAAKIGVSAVMLATDRGTLQTSLGAFTAYGIRDSLGDFGEQVFLPEHHWVHVPAGVK